MYSAETPFLRVVISHAAANHSVSGVLVACRTVPAVADTRRRQPRHLCRPSGNFQLPVSAQCGQTNPSGQRSKSR